MAKQDNNNQDNSNNNFFNNNPLLAFAIFSIVIIMIFKSFVGEGDGLGNMLDSSSNVTQTKTVKYSEIKAEIEKGTITSVKLTPTTVEAIADADGCMQVLDEVFTSSPEGNTQTNAVNS